MTQCGPVLLLLLLSCTRPETPSVRDDLGRPVPVPSRVERVVTLAPNLTEIVFAVGAGPKLVGTDDFSNEPAAARGLPRVGGMQPSVEKIIALDPDLVIATTSGNHPGLAPALANVSVPLFVVRTDRLEQISQAMRRIGELLDGPQTGSAAAMLEQNLVRQRRTRNAGPRVLFTVWSDPLYVAGSNTFSDDLITLCGGRNAVTVGGWPQYSVEALLQSPPDVVLFPEKSLTREQVEKLFEAAPELQRNLTLAGVDDDLFTRPGPRVGAAAAQLNAIMDRWEKSR